MNSELAENRLEQSQRELNRTLNDLLAEDGNIDLAADLHLFRRSSSSDLVHGESRLALCIIAQGAKRILLGDDVYEYDRDHYLITSMQLPTVSYVMLASPEEPHLSVMLELDPAMVGAVLLASPQVTLAADDAAAFDVAEVDADLLGAVMRLVRVSQHPAESSYLAPLIKQEIVYRLLMGNHGGRLRHIAGMGAASQRLSAALKKLRENYDQPLSIPAIAEESGMSVSSFHDHFKRATGLTPLQYQKHLRLREARRLLISGDIDVASAGYRVGYGDASHFNREYKRMFGEPPLRDLQRLRSAGPLATSPN